MIDPGQPRDRYEPSQPAYAAFRYYPDTARWAAAAQGRLRQWGFNTVGGWSAPELATGPLPYLHVLHAGAELGVPWNDILHPDFAHQIDAFMREHVAPRSNDANLLGWCSDNELGWFADTLFVYHIGQPPTSVTRKSLVRLLRQHYDNDFPRLEADFHPEGAANFDELERGGSLRFRTGGNAMQVVNAFTSMLAQHYYRTVHDAIRSYDKNHLILGDRYHSYTPDVVAEAAGPYVDAVSTNYDWPDWTNGRLPIHYLKRLHQLSGKPILITEYYVAADENRSGNKNSGDIFTTVQSQQERAEAVRNRLSTLASLPYVLGAHWFQYTDEPTFGRQDGEDYNFGLVDIDDRPYEEVIAAFADVHAGIERLHSASGDVRRAESTQTIEVPPAPSEPLDGLRRWDAHAGFVCGRSSGPAIADLLVCWDSDNLYVAVVGSRFVDRNAYLDLPAAANEDRLELRLALDDHAADCLEFRFGVGNELSLSHPEFEVRVYQHGLRYTAIAKLPANALSRTSLAPGDRLTLRASLVDHREDKQIDWNSEFKLRGK